MLTCVKMARVQKLVMPGVGSKAPAASSKPQRHADTEGQGGTLIACEPHLPTEMGAGTLVALARQQQHHVCHQAIGQVASDGHWQSYWAVLKWKLGHPVFYDRGTEQLSPVLPDFIKVIERQRDMSACGVSLPLHGAAAVGHDKANGLYTNWLFAEGMLLTQASLRALVTTTLQQHHASSVHPSKAVGVMVLARPDVLLAQMSLEQARWVHKNSRMVQEACTQAFKAAANGVCPHVGRMPIQLCSGRFDRWQGMPCLPP